MSSKRVSQVPHQCFSLSVKPSGVSFIPLLPSHLLNNKKSTVKALIGFIGWFTNQAGSHLASKEELYWAAEEERFSKGNISHCFCGSGIQKWPIWACLAQNISWGLSQMLAGGNLWRFAWAWRILIQGGSFMGLMRWCWLLAGDLSSSLPGPLHNVS